ncbi:MAG: hypothetical protein C0490_08065, partial [Marivirga sp.]|nr:hypothetical protein [Marivirga sp.]
MVILICFCLSSFSLFAQSSSNLAAATNNFLHTLNGDDLKKTTYQFTDTLRFKWTNLPVGLVPRPGIQYGSLSDSSRIAFHELLSVMLSSQGYLKLTSIMQLDDILNTLYRQALDEGTINQETFKMIQGLNWAHENYFIAVWGKPDEKNPWGISFGGHHIALNLTVREKSISVSPLFIGTDPGQVKSSKYA